MSATATLGAPAPIANRLRIRPLAETAHVAAVAGWLHRVWWAEEGYTLTQTEGWLRDATGPAAPIAFVAELDGVPIGTASLDTEDLLSRPDLTPWLVSVWVQPAWRGQGVATRLVRTVEAAAAALGHREIWLFTEDAAALYRGLGWVDAGPERWRQRPVALLRRTLGATVGSIGTPSWPGLQADEAVGAALGLTPKPTG